MRFSVVFLTLFTAALFWSKNIQSQITITGKVLSSDQKPLEYALISIQPLSDPSTILSTSSNEMGDFAITSKAGTYILAVQMLSHKTYSDTLFFDKSTSLDDIVLLEETQDLKSIEVTAKISTIETQLGKQVLFIGEDISSSGSNAIEALEQVPSVTTTTKGNLQIRGSSNVVIYINGKETRRRTESLRYISAESLQKIEVITNPSAKYDAEGVAGIINLVYKKDRWAQLKLGAMLNFSIPTNPLLINSGTGVNLSVNKNKISIFTNIAFDIDRYRDDIKYSRETPLRQLYLYKNDLALEGKGNTFEANLGISYEPNESLATEIEINYHRWNFKETSKQTSTFYTQQQPVEVFSTSNLDNELENEIWANLAVSKTISQESELNASLTIGGEIESNNLVNNDTLSSSTNIDQFLTNSLESESQRYYQGKIDFVTPFFKQGNLEIGAKVDFIDYDILQNASLRSDSITLPVNDFELNIQKSAIYLIQSNSFEKWEYSTGLRFEQFNSTAFQASTDFDFKQNYLKLFPSLQLNYFIDGRDHIVGVNYTHRIQRPSFFALNPYVSYQDPLNLETGNPSLNPEFSHLVEVLYSSEFENWSISSTFYQRYTINSIQDQITELNGETTLTSPINIGKEAVTGTELRLENRFKGKIKTTLTCVVNRHHFVDNLYDVQYNNTWTCRIRAQQQYTFKNNWKAVAAFTYRAPTFEIQMLRNQVFYLDLSVSKKFKNKRGTLSIVTRDILNSKNDQFILKSDNLKVSRYDKWQTRRISLNLRYNLIDTKK